MGKKEKRNYEDMDCLYNPQNEMFVRFGTKRS
nr:MAG TPA: hypothetical protein [Bacteriophage sp.]